MGMSRKFLEKIISEMDPDTIPEEFMSYAKVTNCDGDVSILTTDEIIEMLSDPRMMEEREPMDIQIVIDIEALRKTVEYYSEKLLSDIPK